MSTEEHSSPAAAEVDPAPPAGEEIHLPGGSILPLVVAAAITLMVIGTTVWWGWSAIGFVTLVVSVLIWVRDVRRDVDALPEHHHRH